MRRNLVSKLNVTDTTIYEDEVNSLVMFFSTSSPKENAMKILDLFAQEQICENWVLESASIGLKDTDGYQVISPENYQGGFEVE